METKKILLIVGGLAVVGGGIYLYNKSKKPKTNETKGSDTDATISEEVKEEIKKDVVLETKKIESKPISNQVNVVSKPSIKEGGVTKFLENKGVATGMMNMPPLITGVVNPNTTVVNAVKDRIDIAKLVVGKCGMRPLLAKKRALWEKCKQETINSQNSSFAGLEEDLFSSFNNFDL